MKVKSYASSSKGNCYLIASDTTNIIVDIGYSATKLLKEVAPDALLITHHHSDHISGLEVFKKHCDCPIFFGESHWLELKMEAFTVSHDVEAYGYTITNEDGERVTIILDSGTVTGEMQEQINLADILIIEANHDEKLIHLSDYHEELIERILSDTGHLSNQQTAQAIKGIKAKVYLAHMSENSNNRAYAKTIIQKLSGKEIEIF